MNLQADHPKLHAYLEENGTPFEQVEERIISLNKQTGSPKNYFDEHLGNLIYMMKGGEE